MENIRISEHFYSIQGEGITVGVPAVFVRLQGCNLLCGDPTGTWRCDTIETWKTGTRFTIQAWHDFWWHSYQTAIKNGAHLVITGGEPLLQQAALIEWLDMVRDSMAPIQPTVEVETNGTVWPDPTLLPLITQWNISPKLSNSGEPASKRIKTNALNAFAMLNNATFKFVVHDESDIQEIMVDFSFIKTIPASRRLLMPAADTRDTLSEQLPKVIDWGKTHGFRVGHRWHIDLWNQTTGV